MTNLWNACGDVRAESTNETTKERAALAESLSEHCCAMPCRAVDGPCVRLRPEYRNHVWSYDFMHHRTDDGRAFRTLNILDDHSRECLAIRVKRKQNSTEVIDALTDLFIQRGVRGYIRSDNDPEFIAEAVKGWVKAVGAKTAYIEPGSP